MNRKDPFVAEDFGLFQETESQSLSLVPLLLKKISQIFNNEPTNVIFIKEKIAKTLIMGRLIKVFAEEAARPQHLEVWGPATVISAVPAFAHPLVVRSERTRRG